MKHVWGLIPLSVRYGRSFRKTRSFLRSSQYWNREKIEAYQTAKLQDVLENAFRTVPYYRAILRRAGIDARHLKNPEILREIPFLTRDLVQEHYTRLQSKPEGSRRQIEITTGGTSGQQMKIRTDSAHRAIEAAFVFDLWGRVGVHPGSRRAVLRGAATETGCYSRPWRYDPLRKELLLSAYNLIDENFFQYLKAMSYYRTGYLHCYPSAALELAHYVERQRNLLLPPLRAILTSSENIFSGQREYLEKNLNARCFDLYGQTEQVALGGGCEFNNWYHFYPQYGYLEIFDKDGRQVTEDGGEGEIVGTGFINTIMPLIRYRTGDWGRVLKKQCSCGRAYPLLETIQGRREQEVLIGKTGNRIPLAGINSHSGIYNRVRRYQFSQEVPGQVTLSIVPAPGYDERDTDAIRRELTAKVGETLELDIIFPTDIPRTARGKFPFLIQHLAPAESSGKALPAQTLPGEAP